MWCKRLSMASCALALAMGSQILGPVPEAHALACVTPTITLFGSGNFGDCASALNINSFATNQAFHFNSVHGPFKDNSGTGVTGFHMTIAGATISSGLFQNNTDSSVWTTMITGSSIWFTAPSLSGRLDHGESYDYQIIFLPLSFPYDATIEYTMDVTDVAEPGTLAILGLGLVGLGAMRRRRRAA